MALGIKGAINNVDACLCGKIFKHLVRDILRPVLDIDNLATFDWQGADAALLVLYFARFWQPVRLLASPVKTGTANTQAIP